MPRRICAVPILLAAAFLSGGTPSCDSPEIAAEDPAASPAAGAASTFLGIPPGEFAVDVVRAAEILGSPPAGGRVALLDVRTPGEIAEGHVEDAVFLDYSGRDFRKSLDALDRRRAYLVFCHSGMRSARTVVAMRKMGFPAVWNVEGGLVAWRRAGLPLTDPNE